MKRNGYLLDTNIVRLWFAKNPMICQRIDALQGNLIYVSVVTIGEIEFAHTSENATDPQKQQRFWREIRKFFETPQLPITEGAAYAYGRFRRAVFDLTDKQGKYTENREDQLGQKCNIDENDLWLVAQAYEHNLTLVTADGMNILKDAVAGEVEIETWPDQ